MAILAAVVAFLAFGLFVTKLLQPATMRAAARRTEGLDGDLATIRAIGATIGAGAFGSGCLATWAWRRPTPLLRAASTVACVVLILLVIGLGPTRRDAESAHREVVEAVGDEGGAQRVEAATEGMAAAIIVCVVPTFLVMRRRDRRAARAGDRLRRQS